MARGNRRPGISLRYEDKIIVDHHDGRPRFDREPPRTEVEILLPFFGRQLLGARSR